MFSYDIVVIDTDVDHATFLLNVCRQILLENTVVGIITTASVQWFLKEICLVVISIVFLSKKIGAIRFSIATCT